MVIKINRRENNLFFKPYFLFFLINIFFQSYLSWQISTIFSPTLQMLLFDDISRYIDVFPLSPVELLEKFIPLSP